MRALRQPRLWHNQCRPVLIRALLLWHPFRPRRIPCQVPRQSQCRPLHRVPQQLPPQWWGTRLQKLMAKRSFDSTVYNG